MRVRINPGAARGTVQAPPSKSMAHRMLVCAGLSAGGPAGATTVVRGLEPSQDTLATIDCLTALGARVDFDVAAAEATVRDMDPDTVGIAAGAAAARPAPQEPVTLPCRECGSTLRFFVPIALLLDTPVTLTGSATLMSRPMGVYADICAQQGLHYQQTPAGITVQGPLKAGTFTVPGNISSQFISGLLFACPLLEGESRICLTGAVESRAYIDMTVAALAEFGVRAIWEDDRTLVIPGGQTYAAAATDGVATAQVTVEGDYSNAAFFAALDVINPEAAVHVEGLRPDTLQGDSIYQTYFAALAEGPATLDISGCPDLGPILMTVAAALSGATLTGAKRLAIKESDRGRAMQQELAKCGVALTISEDGDTITIPGGQLRAPETGVVLQGHNDHRIVMALAVAATLFGAEIDGAQAVAKSLPDFFARLENLGIEVERYEMD